MKGFRQFESYTHPAARILQKTAINAWHLPAVGRKISRKWTIPAKTLTKYGESFVQPNPIYAGMATADSQPSETTVKTAGASPLWSREFFVAETMLTCAKNAAKAARHAVLIFVLFSGVAGLMQLPAFGGQSVTLAWDPSPDPDVAGYNVYYGSASGTYTNKVSVRNETSATISGLEGGVAYFFVVTAYNSSDLESVPSNEASYSVPVPVLLAIKQVQLIGFPAAFRITATGPIPYQWALESSENLRTWRTVVRGTDPVVNVTLVVYGTPALFFRLKGE